MKKPLKSKKNRLKRGFIRGVICSFSKQPILSLFLPHKNAIRQHLLSRRKKNLNFFQKRLNFSTPRSYY